MGPCDCATQPGSLRWYVVADPGEFSDHFKGERGSTYFARQSKIAEISAELNESKFVDYVEPQHSVVDFGCGTGALLARLVARTKTGVEVNPLAREAAATRGLQVAASADELPGESADVIISNHVLEHTLYPLAELKALHHALKPGGRMVLWLPLDDWRSQRVHIDEPDNHLYTWTPLLLGNLLEEAGFELIESRIVTTAWLTSYVPIKRRLPSSLYSILSFLTAVAMRRRQLRAIARRPA